MYKMKPPSTMYGDALQHSLTKADAVPKTIPKATPAATRPMITLMKISNSLTLLPFPCNVVEFQCAL